MSEVNLEILFQSKMINISVNKKENEKELYKKFIDELKSKLDIKDNDKNNDKDKKLSYKLMTMNTKEMYIIVNEDNFLEILNEKTKEGKIKFFLDIVEEEENLIEPLEENMLGGINKNNENTDDFNDKLSLSGSNEFNLENNKADKKDSKIESNNNLENNIINENDINSEDIKNNTINDNKKELTSNNNNENNKNENIIMKINPLSTTKLKDNYNDLDLNMINNNKDNIKDKN